MVITAVQNTLSSWPPEAIEIAPSHNMGTGKWCRQWLNPSTHCMCSLRATEARCRASLFCPCQNTLLCLTRSASTTMHRQQNTQLSTDLSAMKDHKIVRRFRSMRCTKGPGQLLLPQAAPNHIDLEVRRGLKASRCLNCERPSSNLVDLTEKCPLIDLT